MKAKALISVVFKTIIPLLVGLCALVLVIAWLSGMFHEKIAPGMQNFSRRTITEAEKSRVDVVHEVVQPYYEEAVGTLKASNRTEISSRVMAPINKITVRAGQSVVRGETLVELDSRALEIQRAQAQASLVAADAAFRQAHTDLRRDTILFQKNTIPQAQFDQSRTNDEVARAKLNVAKQAVTESDVMLSYTTIKSPRNGIVVDRLAEVGDMAKPGVPLLVIYDPNSLRLEVPVMENLAIRLKIGDKLPVHIDALNKDVMASVDEIVPQAQTISRSFLVKLALPKSKDMFEGLFGRLRIPAGTRHYLCLNKAAVDHIGQLEFVDVVLPDGTLQRRLITTGRGEKPGRVEVLSGLNAGEHVLLKPGNE
ncbi:MAG: efflux RND transporter periplasmic adaptor subunit [Thermoguttaceae bacterium]